MFSGDDEIEPKQNAFKTQKTYFALFCICVK